MKADSSQRLASAYDISTTVATLLQRRLKTAADRYAARLGEVRGKNLAALAEHQASPWDAWLQWSAYAIDGFQRSILFWDTPRMRQQTDAANPWHVAEKAASELLSASLDYYREVRDAFGEASFVLYEPSLMVEFARERALVDKVGAAADAGDRERALTVELHKRLGAIVKPVTSPRKTTPPREARPPRAPHARGK